MVLRTDNLKISASQSQQRNRTKSVRKKGLMLRMTQGKLRLPFATSDVQQAHRIHCRSRLNEPRRLIVKFPNWCDKVGILENKDTRDHLRHHIIRVANDLTRRQSSQLAEVRRQGKMECFLLGKLRVTDHNDSFDSVSDLSRNRILQVSPPR